jgi:dTDP-glucose 4,6-dehydratase
MKRVILTGVGGFIGAHCLEYFLEHTDWEILGIDSFRHKGILRRLDDGLDRYYFQTVPNKYAGPDSVQKALGVSDRVKIFYHDLSVPISPQLENLLMDRKIDDRGKVVEKKIDYVINMASDSAVERSTTDPTHCLRNNYELCINMLEFARKIKPEFFLQVSTDEVYGEANPDPDDPGHKEWATIMPSNPYAASKAAQEAVAISYWRTYDLPVVISNCMNIIGEWQDPEKFLPKIIGYIIQNKEMPIYADVVESEDYDLEEDGKRWKIGSRVYLHARNKADALVFLSKRKPALYSQGAKRPDRYNICGVNELNNLELAQKVANIIKKVPGYKDVNLRYKLIPSESARPGYDRRYALDGTKLRDMGWKPPMDFDESLERIVKWTLQHSEWGIC